MSIVIEATNTLIAVGATPVKVAAPPGLSASSATFLAACIGAGAAIVTMLLKEVAIERLRERRSTRRSEREIYRQYLAPLADACEKIVWRTSEIFVLDRHSFLKTATLPVEFNAYKRRSTLFRIATFIGWIRAMDLELAAIPRTQKAYISPITNDVAAFRRAMADGPHVERHRLEQICTVWKIDLSGQDEGARDRLALRFENELHAAVGSELRADENMLRSLDRAEQIKLCERLAWFLCERLNRKIIDPAIVDETVAQAIRSLSYREALIYRDWQDALGDAVLEPDPDSPRRYKTIGYEAFENLLAEARTSWMKVFATSIDDIDFDEVDPNDFRLLQLQGIAAAAASVLMSIAASGHRDLVNTKTLQAAEVLHRVVSPKVETA